MIRWAVALMFVVPAHAADMVDCRVYANRGSAAALRQLLGLPFIDAAAGRFLYRKAYSFCVNADELPPLTFTSEEQPIVDGLPVPTPRPDPDMEAAWAKCAAAHPRGWDAETHTITKRVSGKWKRVPCP